MTWIGGETRESKRSRLIEWHKWFAWYPVKLLDTIIDKDGKERHQKVWFCYVEMREDYYSFFDTLHFLSRKYKKIYSD
jgi:hypothetical protein